MGRTRAAHPVNPAPRPQSEFPWRGRLAALRNGLPIEVDSRDMIGREILRQGCWEWETYHFLESWLKPGMTVIDVGANVGQYSLLASAGVGAGGRVRALEPHPGLYAVLCRNLRRARCANAVAHPLALGAADERRDLFLHRIDNVGASAFRPLDPSRPGPSVRVAATTLDAYVEAEGLRQVDLVKIDVEGAELEVLDGATTTLAANPDVVLVVEFLRDNARRFGHSVEDLEARLRGLGFSLFSITETGLTRYAPVAELAVNVVACRRLMPILRGLPQPHAALLLSRLGRT
jgi:FkbM family methyltransferase